MTTTLALLAAGLAALPIPSVRHPAVQLTPEATQADGAEVRAHRLTRRSPLRGTRRGVTVTLVGHVADAERRTSLETLSIAKCDRRASLKPGRWKTQDNALTRALGPGLTERHEQRTGFVWSTWEVADGACAPRVTLRFDGLAPGRLEEDGFSVTGADGRARVRLSDALLVDATGAAWPATVRAEGTHVILEAAGEVRPRPPMLVGVRWMTEAEVPPGQVDSAVAPDDVSVSANDGSRWVWWRGRNGWRYQRIVGGRLLDPEPRLLENAQGNVVFTPHRDRVLVTRENERGDLQVQVVEASAGALPADGWHTLGMRPHAVAVSPGRPFVVYALVQEHLGTTRLQRWAIGEDGHPGEAIEVRTPGRPPRALAVTPMGEIDLLCWTAPSGGGSALGVLPVRRLGATAVWPAPKVFDDLPGPYSGEPFSVAAAEGEAAIAYGRDLWRLRGLDDLAAAVVSTTAPPRSHRNRAPLVVTRTGEITAVLRLHSDAFERVPAAATAGEGSAPVVVSETRPIAVSPDGAVLVWDGKAGRLVSAVDGRSVLDAGLVTGMHPVTPVAFVPSGKARWIVTMREVAQGHEGLLLGADGAFSPRIPFGRLTPGLRFHRGEAVLSWSDNEIQAMRVPEDPRGAVAIRTVRLGPEAGVGIGGGGGVGDDAVYLHRTPPPYPGHGLPHASGRRSPPDDRMSIARFGGPEARIEVLEGLAFRPAGMVLTAAVDGDGRYGLLAWRERVRRRPGPHALVAGPLMVRRFDAVARTWLDPEPWPLELPGQVVTSCAAGRCLVAARSRRGIEGASVPLAPGSPVPEVRLIAAARPWHVRGTPPQSRWRHGGRGHAPGFRLVADPRGGGVVCWTDEHPAAWDVRCDRFDGAGSLPGVTPYGVGWPVADDAWLVDVALADDGGVLVLYERRVRSEPRAVVRRVRLPR